MAEAAHKQQRALTLILLPDMVGECSGAYRAEMRTAPAVPNDYSGLTGEVEGVRPEKEVGPLS